MARTPHRDLDGVTMTHHVGELGMGTAAEGGGSLGGDLELSNRFSVDIDDPACPFLVSLVVAAREQRLVVEQVTVTCKPDGPPVTSTAIRSVLLDSYLGLIRTNLQGLHGGLLIMGSERAANYVKRSPVDASSWGDFAVTMRRRRSNGEAVREAARLYQEALGSLDPAIARAPTKYVGKRLHYDRGHASRLITQARKNGLLAPAFKGRAGEHHSSKEVDK